MNRFFTLVAVQSAVAAAVLAIAPLAHAEPSTDPVLPALSGNGPSRETVRQEALQARDQRWQQRQDVVSPFDPAAAPFASKLTRAQVRAEAVEANKIGAIGGYEDESHPTPAQLAQIQRAGERAAAPIAMAGVR